MNHTEPCTPVPGTTPVPDTTDDLEATAQKLEALAKVVTDGNSLALFTGLQLSSPRPRDAEGIAKSQMTPSERDAYENWKTNRVPVPPFDWERNKSALPGGRAQTVKKFTRRAEAMDLVWVHSGATAEHASWLTFNMVGTLPLVKAVTRVLATKKQFRDDPLSELSPMEAAEVETARTIVYIAERNRERELRRIRQLTRSISRSTGVLNARLATLEKSDGGRGGLNVQVS